jgi:hypothetical protein
MMIAQSPVAEALQRAEEIRHGFAFQIMLSAMVLPEEG